MTQFFVFARFFFATLVVAFFSTSSAAQWPPQHSSNPEDSGWISEGGLGECPPGYWDCQLATLAPSPPEYVVVMQVNSLASQTISGGTIDINLWLAEPEIYDEPPRVDIILLGDCPGQELLFHDVYKHNVDDGLPPGWRTVQGTLPNWEPCSQYILWLGHLIGDQQPPFPKIAKIDLEAFRFLWPEMPVAVEPETPVSATTFTLSGPNPFRGATSFELELAEPAVVSVAVYDVLGRQVAVLTDGWLSAGRHTIRWKPQGLPSGTYLVRWGAGELSGTRLVSLME